MDEIHHDVDEIRQEFLKTLIEKDTGEEEIEMKDFHVERATEAGDNFATIVYRIKASYISGCHGSRKNRGAVFIGKFLPVQPKRRESIEQIGFFKREVLVYNDLIPTMINLQKEKIIMPDVPRCIYANEESTPIAAVIMEDLRPKGFRLANKYQGLQPNEIRLLMRAYGRLHALGVLVDRHTDYSSWPIFRFYAYEKHPQLREMVRNSLDSVWRLLEDMPGQKENARRVKDYVVKVDGGKERFLQLSNQGGGLQTFLHGDCWCNNMMFRYDTDTGEPVEMKILDLQIVAYGNPCRDLMFALYCSTSREVREQTPDFLKLYHDTLLDTAQSLGLVLDYSFQDFQKDMEAHEEFGFFMAMFIIPIILAEKPEVPEYVTTDLNPDKMMRLREQQLFSEGTATIKQRLVEVVEHMVQLEVL
ncbi:unnamed protein product [Darwinula stevensoni]|uniref:CHK kinase-like domain-containing protein n=1 Tax=Darwinula stevensoni TaxID=69355 RepID=A0A7R9A6U7_9CRUS|nr:unnamed protein product [Darwinula stevensoni]CAG0895737.1 unnamed protein product [Darwinula stevensoni]